MSPKPGWIPRGGFPWLLTLLAIALAAATAALAYGMTFPVRWDGLGKVGAVALHFPLHLLLATLAALLLMMLASACRARLAAAMFMLMMYLTALMAVIPATASWRQAERLGARVSLGAYVENAAHLNLGRAQQDHSVVYGTGADGTKLELDVWPGPADDSRPTRPAFVLVHGGAWTHGHRSIFPDWDRWLNGLGYEVFDIEYRLPPPVRWLDEVGDVKSALGWLSEHAAEYHVDPARIGIMGASAGGNLAMLAAYSAGDARLPPSTRVVTVAVRTVINLYGPSDLAVHYRDSRSPEYVHAACQAYIGGSPGQFPERYALLSPVTHVGASSPPTITLLGTRDRLVSTEQAVQLDESLSKAGVPHETWLLPANDHGFDVNWGGFGTQIARDKIRRFLDRYDPR